MTEEKNSKNRWSEERKFNIDKKVAGKMLNNRTIKTNSCIKVSAKLNDIRNNEYFDIKENDEGTYDLIIKNVKFVEVD